MMVLQVLYYHVPFPDRVTLFYLFPARSACVLFEPVQLGLLHTEDKLVLGFI